ncbi:MAG: UvrB/UvrC motif-containing protein [Pirellulales bacterium]|nr:UvrB/UvrC motif-containing protein [Pirellulales bacterium]
MSKDISRILDGWKYEPDEVSVRIVAGDDGRDKIQLRLDLGVLQMEMDGRPDGLRPHGYDSWLDYFEAQQQAHDEAHPDEAPFRLESDDCANLLREGIQYYHRYLSFWHLDRYDLCARDTARNLRLLRFVRERAKHERDMLQFDQWRPYITMMHARSLAVPALEAGDVGRAIEAVDAGIAAIRRFLDDYGQSERWEQCGELVQLLRWREELSAQRAQRTPQLESPGADAAALRRRLNEAVADERFEEAAKLRDELRRLTGGADPRHETGM